MGSLLRNPRMNLIPYNNLTDRLDLSPPPHRKWGKKGDLKIQIYFTLYDKRGTSSDGPDTLIVVPIPFMILSSSK